MNWRVTVAVAAALVEFAGCGGDGGSIAEASAPRFESLDDLADRLNELGFGCDDYEQAGADDEMVSAPDRSVAHQQRGVERGRAGREAVGVVEEAGPRQPVRE